MPSSYSARLRFELQFTGEGINLWGDKLNAVFSRVDDSIAGYVAITIPATGDYTLTATNSNTASDEARMAFLKLTGSPSANFNVIIPSVPKSYEVWNNTAKVATVTTGSGSTVTIDAGDILRVWCDGANVKQTTFGGLGLKDYITAYAASAGAVPSPIGNALKFLYTGDGVNVTWRQPSTADLSDYNSKVLGTQVALAVSL